MASELAETWAGAGEESVGLLLHPMKEKNAMAKRISLRRFDEAIAVINGFPYDFLVEAALLGFQ